MLLLALLFAGGMLVARESPGVPASDTAGADRAEPTSPSSPPVPAGTAAQVVPSPTAPAYAESLPLDLLRLPGAVPTRGAGTFGYAGGRSGVFGTKGQLRRFRVAVERRSGEDVDAFAAQVEATLGDRRSWTGGGTLRLQRVSGADAYDFTVYLATRDTAGQLCARGGTNIRVGGRPYTSCRTTGKVIINLDRWRLSAPTYVSAKVPLATYRQYVINHEVGHELGHGHQGCPKRGGPAPVMVQQTLTLRGCVPYAWPRRGARQLVGPVR